MVRFPKAYTMVIDEQVKAMAIKDISTCGADDIGAMAQYAHGRLGKPKRVVIFKLIAKRS